MDDALKRTAKAGPELAGALWRAQAAQLDLPVMEAPPQSLPEGLVPLLPASLARELATVPVAEEAGALHLATGAPALAVQHAADLEFVTGRPVTLHAAEPLAVHALLVRHYGAPSALEAGPVEALDIDPTLPEETLAQLPPVARYLDHVLSLAVSQGASDIHFEPAPGRLAVRLRVAGTLRELPPLPVAGGPAVVARLKVLGGMDLGQRRKAQDGRFGITAAGHAVDLRVATLPTVHGESAVVRVLDPANARRTLDSLGMPAPCRNALTRAARGSGMVLATGPTGSGKTTTLYAVLRHIDASARKVLTVEDPVEYDIPGAVQVNARPDIGMDFARALRSFLRHDPDIILVGEVRDCETARIAAQAALTGHLLLASLHCAGAALAPVRLIELGLERWLVAGALELALAQRLLRTRCRGCGGSGCRACAGSGVGGRSAVFEWLAMTPHLRELLETHDLPSYTRAAEAAIPLSLAAQGRALVDEGVVDAGELAAQLELA